MPGKKNTRFCSRCQVRHAAPTGKKCRGVLDDNQNRFVDLYRDFEELEMEENRNHGDEMSDKGLAEASANHTAISIATPGLQELEFKMQDRMARLESLVVSAVNEMKEARIDGTKKKAISPESSSSEDELFTKQTSTRKREKRREPKYSQQQFALEGENICSFQSVILVGVRLARQLATSGEDNGAVLQHLEFIAKKALMGSYRHEAFISYDRAVRGRAELLGLEAFSSIATEEIATSFCAENLITGNFKNQPTKNTAQQKKRPVKYCRAFNESTCPYRNCVFNHVCMACDEAGHGKQDCGRLRGKPTSNK